MADEVIETATDVHGMGRALAALKKAKVQIQTQETNTALFEISFRLAHACFMTAEYESDGVRKTTWLKDGSDEATTAIRERPDRVEGYYYLALIKGRLAERGGLGGLGQVKEIEILGLKAVELAPGFEAGGPYRLLAMLYAKAPPWPTSIGDVDLGLDYAKKAVAHSDFPLNHLILAEVLIENGFPAQAREELRRVLAAPKMGRWARDGELWRPRARQLLRELK
ncbi:MAG: hypothetical protein QNJ97_12450 [Myxococcota bacterium]|nr:hypothetical protein [Myxococcota bacterium]